MQNKADIRKWMLEKREALTLSDIETCTPSIAKRLLQFRHHAIGAYVPIRGEIDAWSIATLLSKNICLPCIENESRELTFRTYQQGEELIQGKHRIKCPAPSAPPCIPDILFVPLLAFDKQGNRIGYGGGYYDNTIATLRAINPNLKVIGLAHDFQQVDRIPSEAHDVRLDIIATPGEYIAVQS